MLRLHLDRGIRWFPMLVVVLLLGSSCSKTGTNAKVLKPYHF